MGRNKAFLVYSGHTLLERIAAAVREAVGSVTLVGDCEIYGNLGLPVIPDRFAEAGPLAGIEAALSATTADWNLIAACDMPAVNAALLNSLCKIVHLDPDFDCVIPTTPDGRIHPLCAAYHRRCLAPVRDALLRGERKVTLVAQTLRVRYWPAEENGQLQNVNTPLDWSRFNESQPA